MLKHFLENRTIDGNPIYVDILVPSNSSAYFRED